MPIRGLAPLMFALAVTGPAAAEVKSVAPNGFEVTSTATIAASAERVYSALGEVGRWWDPAHTFSRDAANLGIELRAGEKAHLGLTDGPARPGARRIFACDACIPK